MLENESAGRLRHGVVWSTTASSLTLAGIRAAAGPKGPGGRSRWSSDRLESGAVQVWSSAILDEPIDSREWSTWLRLRRFETEGGRDLAGPEVGAFVSSSADHRLEVDVVLGRGLAGHPSVLPALHKVPRSPPRVRPGHPNATSEVIVESQGKFPCCVRSASADPPCPPPEASREGRRPRQPARPGKVATSSTLDPSSLGGLSTRSDLDAAGRRRRRRYLASASSRRSLRAMWPRRRPLQSIFGVGVFASPSDRVGPRIRSSW